MTKESDNLGTDSIQESTKIDDKNTIPMSPSATDESNIQFNNDTDFANFQLGESVIDDSIQCDQFNTNSLQTCFFCSFRNQRPPQTFLWYSFFITCGHVQFFFRIIEIFVSIFASVLFCDKIIHKICAFS